ncbi:MCE associated membrane protein [Mycolicibacterium aurum]|uniref:MCE associated membrane protein n=1 Tax=Mycolicibacterium aurum TaxID=1791 RepID=A0A3S4RXA1_MYCAU|nr:hypothetical protein [Mycolicibacterium aurum]VEG51033.1 MCE associated membrane protein [Mycolicibacterium aurum]
MEDQQPGPGDLTTEDESATAQPRRRFLRRRPKAIPTEAPESPSSADDPATREDAVTAPEEPARTPVGKAARAARTPAAPQEAAAEEPALAEAPADQEPATEDTPDEDTAVDTTDDEAPAEEEVESAEPVVLVPHRPAPKGLVITAAATAVVFVGASAFAAAMVQPYLAERALVQTKLDIARTAADAITTLWSYTPEDMSTLADRASVYLDGGFADEYRRYIDAIVEPNKQAQVTNSTQVVGAAVESVSPPSIPTEATALVYTNSVATSPVTKNIPALRYLSYRLTMQRDGGEWRITRMSTVTSFDLTPQL